MENTRKQRSVGRFGLVGLSGYAAHIEATLSRMVSDRAGPRLAAMYVPDPHLYQERIRLLSQRGVRFHDSYDRLLEDDISAVWLPVPIHLHRSMTEAAIARGVSVMCEKPVAATIDDALCMAAASRRAGVPVRVGYQNLYEPATQALKQTILDARGSKPLRAIVTGGWPRGSHYYRRNDWAGSLRHGPDWVLDGPANNAMAHFINLAVFLLGPSPGEAAEPAAVEAELYRVNSIESHDTVSARVHFADGSTLTLALTHACSRDIEPTVRIMGDRFEAIWRNTSSEIDVEADGEHRVIHRDVDPHEATANYFVHTMASGAHSTPGRLPAATIDTSLAHTAIVNGAFEATSLQTLPSSEWCCLNASDTGQVKAINGIEDALNAVAAQGCMLHELGFLNWTRPAGRRDLAGYRHFVGPRALSEITLRANKPDPRTSSMRSAGV